MRHVMRVHDLDSGGVDETIGITEEHDVLLGALRSLPRRQRDCVALRYLLDLPVAEIATTLELSQNSVKTHLKRGLASLRRTVGLTDDDGGWQG